MMLEVTLTDGSGRTSSHKVELTRHPETGAWVCKVDGADFAFDSARPEADTLSLLRDGDSYEVRRDGDGSNFGVVVGTRRYAVEISDPRSLRGRKAKAGFADGPRKITAPMPGKVVRILAAEGAEVELGQGVIVIEAMKMQNELKAPKAGKVQKVLAAEGTAVNAGDALAVIE